MNDLEYWKMKIREDCNLVEGEEFARLMGIHTESQLWLKNKDELQNLRDVTEKLDGELQKRIDDETKHINHPKQIYRTVQHNCEYNLRVCEILKEIIQTTLQTEGSP